MIKGIKLYKMVLEYINKKIDIRNCFASDNYYSWTGVCMVHVHVHGENYYSFT